MENFNLQPLSENHFPEHRQSQPVPSFRNRSTTATSRYLSYPPTTAVFHANSEPTLTVPVDYNSDVYGNSIPYHQQKHVYPSQNPYPSATTVPYPQMSSGFVQPYAPYETPNRDRQISQHVPTSYGQADSYNTNQHLNQYLETLSISSPQGAPMNSPNSNMSQMNSPSYASTDTSCTSNYSGSPTPHGMFTNSQEVPVIQLADSIQPDSTMMPSSMVTMNDADRRKERNRKASQKSREKKKKLILNQALEIEELKRRNEELKKRIEQIYQYCRGHHFPLPNF